MQIDPERLHSLRHKKGMSRPQLAKQSGITERTIQRLEKEPQPSQKKTLNRLAKALGVEQGVLTGELPLPPSDKASASDPEPVQIGAQIAPKARLAYDLIKRRYGVTTSQMINMAPLFFTLLAEGSLAWRRKKLQEAIEAISRLDDCGGHFAGSGAVAQNAYELEEESVEKVDLFGEHLFFSDTHVTIVDEPFDPSVDNPFASYLRKLAKNLHSPGIVNVEDSDLWLKLPDYDICRDELEGIANGSAGAKRALETGHVRLSQIPGELMAEDAGVERAKWLEAKLPNILKNMSDEDREILGEYMARDSSDKLKNLLEERDSQKTDSTEEGDDQ